MKTYVRILFLFTLLLSPALSRAEIRTVTQNFHTMSSTSKITFNSPTNTIGTTDSVTYTCSDGARFTYDTNSGNKIAIFLDATDAQVVTTSTLIQNLDSIRVYYAPTADKEMVFSVSEDGSSWTDLSGAGKGGVLAVGMPRAGDYKVRIRCKNNSNKVYIKEIRYYYVDLSDCPNCFVYKP